MASNEIVSRLPEGGIWRYTYAEAASRSRRLANALIRLGVRHQDRVGTLAWNTHRHYELYYAVSGSGAIIHTVNPRLFPEQVVYILNHAGDEVLFFDITFLPLVEKDGAGTHHREAFRGAGPACGDAAIHAAPALLRGFDRGRER